MADDQEELRKSTRNFEKRGSRESKRIEWKSMGRIFERGSTIEYELELFYSFFY